MPIKSIIIDNKQTTAKRIAPDKVQLDLVALPLDEQNDAEPNLDIRLYINGQLLQNLQSGANWCIKEMVVIDNSDAEQITIELEDVVQWVKSKVKHILIQGIQKPIELKNEYKNLYQLYQKNISEFKIIDKYFQELVKLENKHDEKFVVNEFNKIYILADLRYQIKDAKELEFYEIYKDKIEKIITYSKNEMSMFDVSKTIEKIKKLINEHNGNLYVLRQKLEIKEDEKLKIEEKNNRTEKIEDHTEEKKKIIAQLKVAPSNIINKLPDRFKNDREIVKSWLEQGFLSLYYVGENLKNDKEIVKIALNRFSEEFLYISDLLKTDEEFIVECLKDYWTPIISYLSNYVLNRPIIQKTLTNIADELKGKYEKLKQNLDKIDKLPQNTENNTKRWSIYHFSLCIQREFGNIDLIINHHQNPSRISRNGNIKLIQRANGMLQEASEIEKKDIIKKTNTNIKQEIPKMENSEKKAVLVKTEKEVKIQELETKMKKIENLQNKIYDIENELNTLQDQIKNPWTWFFGRTADERRERPIKIERQKKLIKEAEELGKKYNIKWSGFTMMFDHGSFFLYKNDIETERMVLRNELKKIDPNRRPNRRKE